MKVRKQWIKTAEARLKNEVRNRIRILDGFVRERCRQDVGITGGMDFERHIREIQLEKNKSWEN